MRFREQRLHGIGEGLFSPALHILFDLFDLLFLAIFSLISLSLTSSMGQRFPSQRLFCPVPESQIGVSFVVALDR
jgi:hypothetical protein